LSSPRRTVRATAAFFDDLDRQLRHERGPWGEPSVNDFQTYELIRIVDRFATGFDDLPMPIEGRRDYRLLVTEGMLVPRLAVVGQLVRDGTIELLQLDLDLDAEW
jgi:hypothetical protein